MTLNNVRSISRKKDVEGVKAIERSSTAALGLHQCDWPYWNSLIAVNRKAGVALSLALSLPPFSPALHLRRLHFISSAARKCLAKCEMPTFRWPLFPCGATFGICHAPYFLCCGANLNWDSAGDSSSSTTNFMKHSCSFLLSSSPLSNIAEALVSKGLATVIRYRQDDDQRSSHYDELLAAEARWGLALPLFLSPQRPL